MSRYEFPANSVQSGIIVDDTGAHNAPSTDWFCVHALEDTVIASLTSGTVNKNADPDGSENTLTTLTLKSGCSLYGRFSAITLTSGSVQCLELS